MINWYCALLSFIFLSFMWAWLGLPAVMLMGIQEDWHVECDLTVKDKNYNGRKTYYLLSVQLRQKGFMHSTFMR